MAALRPDPSFLRFGYRFHYYQVGQAARSDLLAHYQHRILSAIAVMLHEYDLYHEDRELVVSTHREMMAAIEARDPAWVERAADHHWATSGGAFASLDFLSEDDAEPNI